MMLFAHDKYRIIFILCEALRNGIITCECVCIKSSLEIAFHCNDTLNMKRFLIKNSALILLCDRPFHFSTLYLTIHDKLLSPVYVCFTECAIKKLKSTHNNDSRNKA